MSRDEAPHGEYKIYRAEVLRTEELSPGMVRIVFGGNGLDGFASTGVGDEYLRVFFPDASHRREIALPHPTENGGWDFDENIPEEDRAPLRTYTVRDVRAVGGDRDGKEVEVDIDFVVHDGGVAAAWALRAEPGDVVGLNWPTGMYDAPDELSWQLLVTDQTGLPAVARLLATSPDGVRTRAVIEVPDADHEIPLPTKPGSSVTWVHGGNGHGPSRLAEIVQSALTSGELPEDLAGGYVWVAGETKVLRDVRKYLRKERGLSAERFKVVGYWTYKAEEWREAFAALDDDTRDRLYSMWDSDRDEEEIEDEYIAELEKLGL